MFVNCRYGMHKKGDEHDDIHKDMGEGIDIAVVRNCYDDSDRVEKAVLIP